MRENRRIAYCGALYLVDQCQERDDRLTRRQQKQRIRKHLRQYTYLDRNNKALDVKAFRLLMADIARENRIPTEAFEDRPDALWRVKSEGLKRDRLKLYGYNKDSFDSSCLPRAARGTPVSDSESDTPQQEPMPPHVHHGPIQRSQLTVLKDIDAVKHDQESDDYKYADKESRLLALQLLIQEYNLTYRDKDRDRRPVSDRYLYRSIQMTFAHVHDRYPKNRDSDVIWKTGTDHFGKRWLSNAEKHAKHSAEDQKSGLPGSLPTVSRKSEVQAKLAEFVVDETAKEAVEELVLDQGPSKKRKLCSPLSERSSSFRGFSPSPPLRKLEPRRQAPISYAESVSDDRGDQDVDIEDIDDESVLPSKERQPENPVPDARAALNRSFHIVLQDVDRVLNHRKHPDYKYATRTGRLSALELLIRQYGLTTTNPKGDHSKIVTPTALKLEKSINNAHYRYAKVNLAPGASFQDLWTQGSKVFKQNWRTGVQQQATYFTRLHGGPSYGTFPTVWKRQEVADALQRHGESDVPVDVAEVSRTPPARDFDSSPSLHLSNVRNGHSALTEDTTTNGDAYSPVLLNAAQSVNVVDDVSAHFDRLLTSIQQGVTAVLEYLQLFADQPTPIPRECNELVDELFRQCWGSQWRQVCPDLSRNDLLCASSAMRALISAFLFNKLLHNDWQRTLCEQMDLLDADCLKQMVFGLKSPDRLKAQQTRQQLQIIFARTIDRARHPPQQPAISKFVSATTAELQSALEPYFDCIVVLATVLRPYEKTSDAKTLQQKFAEHATAMCSRAMDLKIALSKSSADHEFSWPLVDDSQGTPSGASEIAYTLGPGLRIRAAAGEEWTVIREVETLRRRCVL